MSEELSSRQKPLRLSELNSLIGRTLSDTFPSACWVVAEVAELKCNQKGHCYLELIEKKDEKTIAQIRATVWAYDFRRISLEFERTAGEQLKAGMKLLLAAQVTFHEVYGLSLNIKDIDPTYTLGEMARKKKEIIERLRKEGLIDKNKGLELPLVPQRIAVISSPTAAGYGDFFDQLDNNQYGFRFFHTLFPAVMQGPEAVGSVMSALKKVAAKKSQIDVVVIIRGGGSVADLSCFDNYELARAVVEFQLPVITGIGHEKDDTVVDIVAHTKMKTPTAVAEFLISGILVFEEQVLELHDRMLRHVTDYLKDRRHALDALIQRLAHIPARTTSFHLNRLVLLEKDMANNLRQAVLREDNRLTAYEQAARHLDPSNVLRRGYSITRHKGKIVKDASALKKWAVVETRFHKGSAISIIQEQKEDKADDQGKTGNLLPGFE